MDPKESCNNSRQTVSEWARKEGRQKEKDRKREEGGSGFLPLGESVSISVPEQLHKSNDQNVTS